jgi:hypothetical protein
MWKLVAAGVVVMGAVGLLAPTEAPPATPPAEGPALASPFPEGNDFDGLAARMRSLRPTSTPGGPAAVAAR